MELVLLNSQPWAIGLVWAPPVTRFASGRKLLSQHAREYQDGDAAMNIVVRHRMPRVKGSREKRAGQEGFGASPAGQWKRWHKARALAACMDTPLSFLGLFPLVTTQGEAVWWLVCRLNGAIPEQGDQVFRSESAAREALGVFRNISGISQCEIFESVEESKRWFSENCRLSSGDIWIRDKGRLLNLRRFASRTAILRACVALGLSACIIGSAVGTYRYMERTKYEAARQAREANLQRQKDLKERPEKFFDMAWQNAPLSTDMARQCLPALMDLPLSSHGWELGKAVCNGAQLKLDWKHADGGDFINLPDNGKVDAQNSRLAHSSRAIAPLREHTARSDGPGTDHSMLVKQDTASGLLSEIAQGTGTRLTLTFKAQARKTIDKITVVAPWHEGSWALNDVPDLLMAVGAGEGLFEMLSEVPGLSIDEISHDGSWSVKGKIYASH